MKFVEKDKKEFLFYGKFMEVKTRVGHSNRVAHPRFLQHSIKFSKDGLPGIARIGAESLRSVACAPGQLAAKAGY